MILKLKRNKYTALDKVFLLIWTFYSIPYFILGSELGIDYNVESLSKITTYVTLLLQVFMLLYVQRYKLKDALKYIIILVVLFLVELSNSDSSLLVFVLFIILAQYIDVYKLLRYDVILKTCLLIFIVGMCVMGVISNYTAIINGVYKQSWGFSQPNVLTVYVLIILLEWLCVRYKKMKWYEWLFVLGFAVAIMQIGGGRSSVYTFALVFLLFIIANIIPGIFYIKPVKIAFILVTPLMAVVSFWAVSLYNQGNAIAIALNSIMTNRISFAARFLNTYDIGLFGQEIEYVSSRSSQINNIASNILDNAYIRCALDWGLLVLFAFIIAYIVLFRKLLNSHKIELALVCLFFVLLGIGETYMLKPIYNLSLLCLLGFNCSDENRVVENNETSNKRMKLRLHLKR